MNGRETLELVESVRYLGSRCFIGPDYATNAPQEGETAVQEDERRIATLSREAKERSRFHGRTEASR